MILLGLAKLIIVRACKVDFINNIKQSCLFLTLDYTG